MTLKNIRFNVNVILGAMSNWYNVMSFFLIDKPVIG